MAYRECCECDDAVIMPVAAVVNPTDCEGYQIISDKMTCVVMDRCQSASQSDLDIIAEQQRHSGKSGCSSSHKISGGRCWNNNNTQNIIDCHSISSSSRNSSSRRRTKEPVHWLWFVMLVLLYNQQVETVNAARIARMPRSSQYQMDSVQGSSGVVTPATNNLWERPCGDGRWVNHKQRPNKTGKRSHVRDVFHQTKIILNMVSQRKGANKALESLDADWDHLIKNFHFPIDFNKSFTKAHRNLQQYMAYFNQFARIAGENADKQNRNELKEIFETMQRDSRKLLCLVESVINGTHTGRNGAHPRYKYMTRSFMEKKLKSLRAITDQNFLVVSRVIIDKYEEFIGRVSKFSRLRSKRLQRRKLGSKGPGAIAASESEKKNRGPAAVGNVRKAGQGALKKAHNNNNNNNNNKNNKNSRQYKRQQKGQNGRNGQNGPNGRINGLV